MTNEKHKYCKHRVYGVGSAILTQYRRKPELNLYMVEFYEIKEEGKLFFLQKEFTQSEDIEFITPAEASRLYKEARRGNKTKRTKNVQNNKKNLSDLLDSIL